MYERTTCSDKQQTIPVKPTETKKVRIIFSKSFYDISTLVCRTYAALPVRSLSSPPLALSVCKNRNSYFLLYIFAVLYIGQQRINQYLPVFIYVKSFLAIRLFPSIFFLQIKVSNATARVYF